MLRRFVIMLVALSLGSPLAARAEPSSAPALVKQVRVYEAGTGSVAFVTLATSDICQTTVFKINLTGGAGPGMLSAAMTALAARKYVIVEIANSTGCTGYGTLLQSLAVND